MDELAAVAKEVATYGLPSALLWRLLGPTASYLGGKSQELTQKSVENIERILKNGYERLRKSAPEGGSVPPRVLRLTVNEGAFTEDAVAAAYLGGVLASSKTDDERDDRGVCINGLISRLSVFQIRLHYVCYMAMHHLWQGTDGDFMKPLEMRFGVDGFLFAMGFHEDLKADDHFNIESAITHALYGLNKEELFANWVWDWKSGLICAPTPIGAELFLWANGHGKEGIEFFFSKDFEPLPAECEISIIPGWNYSTKLLDHDEVVEINGFDYRFPSAFKCRWPQSPGSTG